MFKTSFKENKIVWIAFCIGIIVCLYPLLSTSYFVTLDGANHLYNSSILNNLVSRDGFTQQFLNINNELTPNYSSLLILSFLLTFMKGVWALKSFHIIHIIGFLLGFIYWNKRPKMQLGLVLIFPFIYSTLFTNGFYNFTLSFILLFVILQFYEKTKLNHLKKYIVLAALLLILYLSHSIVFAFTGLALLHYEVINFFINKDQKKETLKNFLRLAIAALPCFILAIIFMGNRDTEIHYLDFSILLNHFITGFSIATRGEWINTYKVLFISIVLILGIISAIIQLRKQLRKDDYLLFTAISTLVLYFILPDSVGFASVFSVRIEYFFWIFFIAWLSRSIPNLKSVKISVGVLSIVFFILQIQVNIKFWKELDHAVIKTMEAQKHIEEHSVVYPIFSSNVWEHLHISNFLGVDKNLFILENSAARQDYFPIQYHHNYEQDLDKNPGLSFLVNGESKSIDYVIKIGNNEPDIYKDIVIYQQIKTSGALIFKNELIELWKRN